MRAVRVPVPAEVMPELDQILLDVLLRRSHFRIRERPQSLAHNRVDFVRNEPGAGATESRSSMDFDCGHSADYGHQPNE